MRLLPVNNFFSTAEAMRQNVLRVAGVTSVSVLTSDDVAVFAATGNKIEVIVQGGEGKDDEIAQRIWEAKPAGIQLCAVDGAPVEPITITDTCGYTHNVVFSRVNQKQIVLSAFVTAIDNPPLETGWDEKLKDGLLALGNTYGVGQPVIAQQFYAPAFQIPGIDQVTLSFTDPVSDPPGKVLWDESNPGDGTIFIGAYKVASFSRDDIIVGIAS
jgi:hypothetical protein